MRIKKVKIEYILLITFILMSPFYFSPSGLPQIADFFAAFMIIAYFIKNNFKIYVEKNNPFNLLFFFVFWTLLVNLLWTLKLGNTSIVIYSIYYLYNCLFIYILYLLTKKNIDVFSIIYKSVSFTLILQFLLSFLVVDFTGFRQNIFFNNPNQLGYFGLCSLTILLYLSEYYKLNKFLFTISLLSGIYIIAISLSNAAMLSAILLLIIHFFRYIKKALKYLSFFILVFLVIMLFIPEDSLINTVTNNVYLRITGIPNEPDASLAARGYDRIINHPEYWFVGAGEGNFYRFDSLINGEMHSSWGTIFFGYGIVGMFIFLLFLINVFKYKKNFFYFIPVFFYGLTHQGLRSTYLWLIFLIFITFKEIKFDRKNVFLETNQLLN